MANKYKKFVATAATATLVASAIVPVASAAPTDITGNQFEGYINDAIELGLFQDNAKFNPNGTLTRGHVVLILGRYLEAQGFEAAEDYATNPAFTDLAKTATDEYLKTASIVKEAGVFTGSNGVINWNNPIKREAMAAVLDRLAGTVNGTTLVELAEDIEDKTVADLATAQTQYQAQIQALRDLGITTVDNFNPKGDVKRGQFAKFIMESLNVIDNGVVTPGEEASLIEAELTAVTEAVAALTTVDAVTAETAEAATKTVEAVTAAVEALTKAAAVEGVTAEDKAVADKAIADATAAAKAVTDAIAAIPAVEKVAVEGVTAINETSVKVTLTSTTNEDLIGKQVTLTAGETTVTATYVPASLTAKGEATFKLDEEAKLVDAATYTTTSEWATIANPEFVAKVAAVFAKSFQATTTDIPAANSGKVYFSAKDQYGEALELTNTNTTNLKATATINGVPVSAGLVTVEDNKYVAITKALAEGDKVEVTVSNTINKEVYTNSFSYTVVKAADSKATTLGAIKATKNGKEVTELTADKETVKLSTEVLDQFGNPVVMTSSDSVVTWSVSKGADLITVDGKEVKDVFVKDNNFEFTTVAAGTVVIDAYLENGKKVQYTVEIAPVKLAGIQADTTSTVVTADKYNNEEVIVAEISAKTGGSVLKAEDIKLDVKPGTGLTADDVKVSVSTAVKGKGEEAKEVIVVKATTTKAGTFTVTPYIGESLTAEGVIVADAFDFTTVLNPVVTASSIEEIKANEITANSVVSKEITLTNVYKEVIGLPSVAKVISSNESVATAELKLNQDGKTVLTITGKAAGNVVFTVVTGAVSKQVSVNVVAAAELTTVSLGNTITNGVFASEDNATVQVVDVKDQYGNAFLPELNAITLENSTANADFATLTYYTTNAKGEIVTNNIAKEDAKGLALVINAKSMTNTANETAKVTAKVATKEVSALNVTVQPAKVLNKVAVSATATNVTEGSTTTVRVVPTNQYGEVVAALDKAAFATTATGYSIESAKAVTENEKLVGYDVVVKTAAEAAKGKTTVDVKVTATGVEKSANIDLTKVDALDAISNIKVKEVTGLQNATTGVVLETVITDASNKVVEVASSDLEWTVTGVKDASGKALEVTAGAVGSYTVKVSDTKTASLSLVDGVLKSTDLDGFIVDVAVKVESKNNTTATTTVKIDDTTAKYVSGFAIDTVTSAGEEIPFSGTSFVITDKDAKSITFTFTGVDQYGDEFPVVEGVTANASGDLKVSFGTGNTEFKGSLTVEAVKGSVDGKVYIRYGSERLTLDVNVASEVKEELAK